MTIALSAVRTVTAGRLPPNDANGDPLFDHDPFILFFGCYDGTICVVDVRDPQLPFEYQHSRSRSRFNFQYSADTSLVDPIMASAWANNIASPVFGDQDYTLSLAKIRDVLAGRGHTLCNHRGPIWVGLSIFSVKGNDVNVDRMLLHRITTPWWPVQELMER
jgi:hypothetical protein